MVAVLNVDIVPGLLDERLEISYQKVVAGFSHLPRILQNHVKEHFVRSAARLLGVLAFDAADASVGVAQADMKVAASILQIG